ncbi:MAG TPA: type IV pilin protein [Gammaproteobacteria bacterium]|nr:type IV pilin protein [Gammaproteobacteria bacterium]
MNSRWIFSERSHGFTLIELMIVIAIVALLAAIALPSYSAYVLRGKRAEGRAALLDLAAREERWYSDNNQYTDVIGAGGINVSNSENNYYTLSATITGPSNQTFTLKAAPNGFSDPKCGSFTLNQAGSRALSPAGDAATTSDCWGR